MKINFIFFIAWIAISFLLTFYFKRKIKSFKKIGTPTNFFGIFVVFVTLHKIISDLLNVQEITFLFLGIMSFGIALSLIVLKNKDYRRKKTEKEIIHIQRISAQSQLNNYNKNHPKHDY